MADSSQTRLGIICAIIASISFSINDASIKFISGGYPLHEVVTFRAGISLIISLAVISLAGMIALTVSIGKEQRQKDEPKSYHEAE